MQFHGDEAVVVHHVARQYVVLTFMSWSNRLSPHLSPRPTVLAVMW